MTLYKDCPLYFSLTKVKRGFVGGGEFKKDADCCLANRNPEVDEQKCLEHKKYGFVIITDCDKECPF